MTRHAAAAPDLVVRRPEGLYCPQGDFHIDPGRAVRRAVITHAHADHARRGCGAYLCSADGAGVLRLRLGDVAVQTLRPGEHVELGGVRVSLHPAGHVLGSAQVRLEHRGRVWVVSGDYFVSGAGDANPTCAPFEPVRCHCFVTESTFALPVYRWPPQRAVLDQIGHWWRANAEHGRPSLLLAYSFGKAQRLLAGIDADVGAIVVHDAVHAVNAAYRAEGVPLPQARCLGDGVDAATLRRALLVVPPGALGGPWGAALAARVPAADWRSAFASGWMQLRSARRRDGLDRGFVLSDHADWPGLQRAVAASGAERVIVTHGHEAVLVRWLREQGLRAGCFGSADGDDSAGG